MSLREQGINPRALGSNPRATGTHPRAIRKLTDRQQLSLVTDDYQPADTPLDSAQTLLGDLIDTCRLHGIILHRRTIGQLAKGAKELLEDGFTAEVIGEGLRLAVASNEPHRLPRICEGLNLARAGALLDRRDFDRKLHSEMEVARLERRL